MKKSYEDTEIVINSVIEKIICNESRRARLKGKWKQINLYKKIKEAIDSEFLKIVLQFNFQLMSLSNRANKIFFWRKIYSKKILIHLLN